MDRKTEFWWASIAGADPEPVEKTEHEGRPCVYTLGCADPFYLDLELCPILFVPQPMARMPSALERPRHPDAAAAEAAERALAKASAKPTGKSQMGRPLYRYMFRGQIVEFAHGWRGPR